MKLKPGSRLRSQVDGTEIIVVRAPAEDIVVSCGGHPMIDAKEQPAAGLAAAGTGEATKLGKRYTARDMELLVTKPGAHGLAADGEPLVLKEAKPLPASD
ncbi:hypothetical protein [Amycolatopsis sp.]|uniref:hypothetical protein n=1 Tax=Amycolatopsis sp. TaxID=37632 RepID=UPI002BF82A03|nr:hypothetical protein [Amycolatopsis sp.]HVV08031.1 hypothetical protein [Amycolatopsis sp.]